MGWGTRRGVENSQGLAALVLEFFSTVGCSASWAGNDLRALDFFLCGLCWRGKFLHTSLQGIGIRQQEAGLDCLGQEETGERMKQLHP